MKYLPHHRDHDFESIEECDGFYRSALATILIVIMIYAMAYCAVEAWFKEAQNQERYYSKPATVTYEKPATVTYEKPVTATYEKPAAYRLQSPTAEQMDKLHDMQRIAEVSR